MGSRDENGWQERDALGVARISANSVQPNQAAKRAPKFAASVLAQRRGQTGDVINPVTGAPAVFTQMSIGEKATSRIQVACYDRIEVSTVETLWRSVEVVSRQGIGGLDKQSMPASVESLTRESSHGVQDEQAAPAQVAWTQRSSDDPTKITSDVNTVVWLHRPESLAHVFVQDAPGEPGTKGHLLRSLNILSERERQVLERVDPVARWV